MNGPPSPIVQIHSPADPRVSDYLHLKGADRRRPDPFGRGGGSPPPVIIEGHLALRRALKGPLELNSVLMTPARAESLGDLRALLDPGVPVLVADRDVLAELTGFDVHRGVLASAVRPTVIEPNQLLGANRRVAVLEGLTDLENVGAVFRVAAALGIGGVLLDDRCADPLYRRCVRVSLGWSTVLPHARVRHHDDLVTTLHEAGFTAVALTPSPRAVAVHRAADDGLLDEPVGLLVGSEGPGLEAETIAAADAAVSIPMSSGVDSLNAATSLAVVAAFAASRRGWS